MSSTSDIPPRLVASSGPGDTEDTREHEFDLRVLFGTDQGPDTFPLPIFSPEATHRHRPAPGRWTPPAEAGGATHARTEPIPRVSQVLAPSESEFAAFQGVLPDFDEEPAERPPVRRTRVTLTSPPGERRHRRSPGEESRVYVAPPGGLGKFDLGSVPASVTPPRTWRRAAWFASMASGAVVVALLVAGTALVGDSTESANALRGWPGHNLPAPVLPTDTPDDAPASGERSAEPPPRDPALASAQIPARHPDTGTATEPADDPADTGDDAARDPGSENGADGPDESEQPPAPHKPPVTPATTKSAPVLLWAPHDVDTLAQHSQRYFNTVTEDSAAAHALTGGELAAGGADALATRYADIAYFEVHEVYVDSGEGYTLNSVTATFADGTSEQQTRKLVFDSDARIEADIV